MCMSVAAVGTGSALSVDLRNCFVSRIGSHGVPDSFLDEQASRLAAITRDLNNTRGTGWERWRLLPFEPMRSEHLRAVRDVAQRYRGNIDNLVVLGIGGSALGNIALQAALNPVTWNLLPNDHRNGPRLFVLDNADPHLIGHTLDMIRVLDPTLSRTLVNVVSKSGETAETAAQFMIFRSVLREALGDRAKDNIVAITDPEKGTMRAICDAEKYTTLPVPEGVGGRFSVLSPVGLFSSAMCGIDVDALLDGAAAMDERCQNESITDNPAGQMAAVLIELIARGKPNCVMMPYSNNLYSLADWFRQLWAESLGKRVDRDGDEVFAGGTPIKALGATDQHSQMQLYREGPNDKAVCFLEVEHFDGSPVIPADLDVQNLSYLHGQSVADLLNAEKRATEYALVESERPNMTIRFPRIDAHSVGQFIQLWEITTAYAGRLLNIDAYDQPAVETGKVATFGLMGRPGYDEWRQKVDARLGSV